MIEFLNFCEILKLLKKKVFQIIFSYSLLDEEEDFLEENEIKIQQEQNCYNSR